MNRIHPSLRYFILLMALNMIFPAWAVPKKTYIKETVHIWDGGPSFKAISQLTLVEDHNAARYSIRNLFDHNKKTAWVTKFDKTAVENDNESPLFEIDFDKPVYVKSLTLWNGYQKSPGLFRANQRIQELEVVKVMTKNEADPILADFTLMDTMAPQRLTRQQGWTQAVNLFKTRKLIFIISSIYPGTRYTDLCLSGLTVQYAKKLNYKPSLSWRKLETLIERNKTKSYHGGWDWAGFDGDKYPKSFIDFLYYVLKGNKTAYAMFRTYNPEGAADSEGLELWRPAVKEALASRAKR